MRITKIKIIAADTTKSEYSARVHKLLEQHEHPGHEAYLKKATELFAKNPDSESLLPIILSA